MPCNTDQFFIYALAHGSILHLCLTTWINSSSMPFLHSGEQITHILHIKKKHTQNKINFGLLSNWIESDCIYKSERVSDLVWIQTVPFEKVWFLKIQTFSLKVWIFKLVVWKFKQKFPFGCCSSMNQSTIVDTIAFSLFSQEPETDFPARRIGRGTKKKIYLSGLEKKLHRQPSGSRNHEGPIKDPLSPSE